MAVVFKQMNEFTVANITSPAGGIYTVNPFDSLECTITHRKNRGNKGFGVTFKSGKTSKTLSVGTVGETEQFLKDIRHTLGSKRFWAQGVPV
jgi:hypothetical protein